MNKQQFLEKLKNRLNILSESEVKDILDEYSDVIDQKVQEGMTEEDAVKDFGDINDLANEILEAYKINTKKKHFSSHDTAQQIGNILQDIINYLEKFFSTLFKDLSVEKVSRSLVLFGVAAVLIFVLQVPFFIIRTLVILALETILPYLGLGSALATLISSLLSIVFIVLVVMIVISFVRVGFNDEKINVENLFRKPFKDGFKFDGTTNYQKKNYHHQPTDNSAKEKKETTFEDQRFTEDSARTQKNSNPVGNAFVSSIVWFIRLLAFIVLLPLWIIFVILSVMVGILFYLWFIGVPLLGIILILIGLLGLFNTVASRFTKLVFNKKQTLHSMGAAIIISSLFIGIGIPVAFNDLSRLKPVYLTSEESTRYPMAEAKFKEEIPYFKDAVYDFWNHDVTFIFDDELVDTIIIEGYGKNFVKVSTQNFDNSEFKIYVSQNIQSLNDLRSLIKTTIDAIKEGNLLYYDTDKIQITVRIPKGDGNALKVYDFLGNVTTIIEQD